MKRTALGICLLLVFCAFLYAGGQDEGAATAPMAAAELDTPLSQYYPEYQYPEGKITLKYWNIMGNREGWKPYIEHVVKTYEGLHPNVQIEVRDIPNQKRTQILMTAYQADKVGDIFMENIATAYNYGQTDPAPEWARKYMEENYTDYVIDGFATLYGKFWGPPGNEVSVGAVVLYSNMDLLGNAGFDAPPKTLGEQMTIARKATVYDASGNVKNPGFHMRFEGAKHFVGEKFLPFADAWMDGTEGFMFNADFTDVNIDNDAFIEAMKLYKKMAVDWKVTNPDLPRNSEVFPLGISAMMNESAFQVAKIDKVNPNLNYELAPVVIGGYGYVNDVVSPVLSVRSNVVWKKTAYPEVAWDFNLFLRHGENDLIFSTNIQSLAIQKKNEAAANAMLSPYKWFKVVQEIRMNRPFNQGVYADPYNMGQEVLTLLGEAVHEVCFYPDSDPEAILKEKAARARDKLKTLLAN